jgi:hypothetical protein
VIRRGSARSLVCTQGVRGSNPLVSTNPHLERVSATSPPPETTQKQVLTSGTRLRRFSFRADVVLVWKLDRAFRSVLDATSTLQRLRGWKVGLRSLTEEYVDTTTAAGELVFHILAAVAQMERSNISERTKASLERARRQGKTLGRPRKNGGSASAPGVIASRAS